jgi:chemotaxis protein CheD
VVKIFAGDWYVSKREDEMLATILGSCVSACIRDAVAGVGGMNHFLLPGDENTDDKANDAARYGLFAMESLINGLLKVGAQKHRLEFKIFGGGNVINNSARIGSKNAAFIREFMKREGYKITSEDLEDVYPRSLHFYPTTGKVMVRKLKRKDDFTVVAEEAKYQQKISKKPLEGAIELF